MPKKPRDPKYSEGARYERKAMRQMLRRRLAANPHDVALNELLTWVLNRQKRYDPDKGGL